MVPRSILTGLVFALPILVVFFAVAAGGHMLLSLGNDIGGMRLMRGVCLAILMMLAANLILLVGTLGFNSLPAPREESHNSDESS